MPDSRESSSKRLVPKLDPVNVMVANKRSPNAERKPMAKSKAPAPKKDSRHVKGGGDAKPMPTKKKGVAAKVQGKGS